MTSAEAVRVSLSTAAIHGIDLLRKSDHNPMPRVSLAIIAALNMTFPDVEKDHDWEDAIKTFSPVMISTNDDCDISPYLTGLAGRAVGYDAHLIRKTSQSITEARISAVEGFSKTYPQHASLAQWYVSASEAIGAIRPISLDEIRTRQEIDSLVFEEACVWIFSPDTAHHAFGERQTPENYDDFLERYKPYLNDSPANATQRSMAQLHMVEMILKVIDDACGLRDDVTLDLPNLFRQSHPYHRRRELVRDSLNEIKYYLARANAQGVPLEISLNSAILFTLTHVGKSIGARRTSSHPLEPGKSTTLREELLFSPLLHDLPVIPRIP